MKTAVFEYGKQPLSEWIKANQDCEKMILKGQVYFDLWNDNFSYEVKDHKGMHAFRREINIGWDAFDLLCGYDRIAKDFHPKEFDITDMHLLDYDGNVNDIDLPYDVDEEQPSIIFKMLANRKYSTRFICDGDYVTTPDKKVLIHCGPMKETITVPNGIETVGRIAFGGIREFGFNVILPEGVAFIDECAFSGSDGLVQINFPDSLKALGESAFFGTSLKEVTLPEGIKEIPACCFQYVYIEKIHFPANLKAIKDCAFVGLGCDEVRLPETVETVGHWSLGGDYKILYVPKTIEEFPHDFYYEEGIDDNYEEYKPIIVKY